MQTRVSESTSFDDVKPVRSASAPDHYHTTTTVVASPRDVTPRLHQAFNQSASPCNFRDRGEGNEMRRRIETAALAHGSRERSATHTGGETVTTSANSNCSSTNSSGRVFLLHEHSTLLRHQGLETSSSVNSSTSPQSNDVTGLGESANTSELGASSRLTICSSSVGIFALMNRLKHVVFTICNTIFPLDHVPAETTTAQRPPDEILKMADARRKLIETLAKVSHSRCI